IRAIFAVTSDPLLVYTSDAFAMPDLRLLSLVFASIIHTTYLTPCASLFSKIEFAADLAIEPANVYHYERELEKTCTWRYLRAGLTLILTYAGVKMILTDLYHIPSIFSLPGIAPVLALTLTALASLLRARRTRKQSKQLKESKADAGRHTINREDIYRKHLGGFVNSVSPGLPHIGRGGSPGRTLLSERGLEKLFGR